MGGQGGSTPGSRAETQQEGGARCVPMGQLLHIIRAGSADGGTGMFHASTPQHSKDVIMGSLQDCHGTVRVVFASVAMGIYME